MTGGGGGTESFKGRLVYNQPMMMKSARNLTEFIGCSVTVVMLVSLIS